MLPGMSFTPNSSEVVVSYGGRIWRVPIAAGAEPIPVPFRVRTELEIGPELAFKYPVDDSARGSPFDRSATPFRPPTGRCWPSRRSTGSTCARYRTASRGA